MHGMLVPITSFIKIRHVKPMALFRTRAARRRVCALFSFILLTPSLPSFAADATAAAFVKQRQLGNNLGTIGYALASRTVTFAGIVQAMGIVSAQTLVREKLSLVQSKYQVQWDENLAVSYAEFFTADELKSATYGRPSAQLASKFSAKHGDVGLSMQAKSTPVLQAFVAEAMNAAFKASIGSAR
jgi:hypothetical protein